MIIRYTARLSPVVPNFDLFNTATNMDDMVSSILAAHHDLRLVKLRFGSGYVIQDAWTDERKCITFIIGTTEAGEDISVGACDIRPDTSPLGELVIR